RDPGDRHAPAPAPTTHRKLVLLSRADRAAVVALTSFSHRQWIHRVGALTAALAASRQSSRWSFRQRSDFVHRSLTSIFEHWECGPPPPGPLDPCTNQHFGSHADACSTILSRRSRGTTRACHSPQAGLPAPCRRDARPGDGVVALAG